MSKIVAVALLAIPLSVGSVQAMAKQHMPACADGQQAKITCVCGTKAKSPHCSKDQWCHAFSGTCSK
jgi:hypothetical protein